MSEKGVDPRDQAQVSCDLCMKEIPVTEAVSEEADDYVRHFCGLECYDRWRAQAREGQGKPSA